MTINPDWDVALAVDAGDWFDMQKLRATAEKAVGAVRVAVSDGVNEVIETTTVTIENLPPTNVSVTAPSPVDEREVFDITFSADDPGNDDITFELDLDGELTGRAQDDGLGLGQGRVDALDDRNRERRRLTGSSA